MLTEFTEIERHEVTSSSDLVILQNDKTGRYHLIAHDWRQGRVSNIMPADAPPRSSGCHAYVSAYSNSGVRYVSGGYKLPSCKAVLRRKLRQHADLCV